jgi:hypothetical protein
MIEIWHEAELEIYSGTSPVGISMIGSLLLGMILGGFFKVLIVVPVCALVVPLIIGWSWNMHQGAMRAACEIGLMFASLQIGYAFTSGILFGFFSDLSQHIQKQWI